MTTQAVTIQSLLNYHTGAVRRVLSNRRSSMVIDDFTQIVNDTFSSDDDMDGIVIKKFVHIVCQDELLVRIQKSDGSVAMAVNGVFTMTIKEDASPVTIDIENPDEDNTVKLLVIYA